MAITSPFYLYPLFSIALPPADIFIVSILGVDTFVTTDFGSTRKFDTRSRCVGGRIRDFNEESTAWFCGCCWAMEHQWGEARGGIIHLIKRGP